MRILIVTMTTLATTGALASTFAADRGALAGPQASTFAADRGALAGPQVTDLEVYGDGVTFVAAGSVTGEGAPALQVEVKARSVVKGDCLAPDAGARPRRFAVPMDLEGAATTRRVGHAEQSFFVRTDPPGLTSAEVCPGSDWSAAVRDVVFVGAKLQVGRGELRLVCQFPAVDGPVADPGCRLLR